MAAQPRLSEAELPVITPPEIVDARGIGNNHPPRPRHRCTAARPQLRPSIPPRPSRLAPPGVITPPHTTSFPLVRAARGSSPRIANASHRRVIAPREHTFGGSKPSASEAVGGSHSPLNFTDPSGYTACPNRGGRGCSASSGPGYTALGIGAGAIAVGAAGYGAAQLWAGPQAITAGGATFSPGSAGGGGAAEELAVLGPEDAGGAVPGIGNLASAADAMRFNSQLDARQRTVRMGLKPAGNANVATNGGVPGRAAGADSAVAPVREADAAPLRNRSRFASIEYEINRKLFGHPSERDRDGALRLAHQFWGARGFQSWPDPLEPGYARLTRYRETGALTIRYGDKAFRSARTLLSTAYHEAVRHVAQARTGNYAREGTKGEAINEIDAYDAELRVARSLGLSQAEIDEIRGLRQEFYDQLYGTSLQDQVDRGDYTVPKGDLAR